MFQKTSLEDTYVGKMHPAFDQDFWVNILSIYSLHNHTSKFLSCESGTFKSQNLKRAETT